MKKTLSLTAAAGAAMLLMTGCSTPEPLLMPAATLEGQTYRWALGETATGQTPMLVFGKDGRLSGFAGCNRIMGTWRADGTSLQFVQVATTRMMCDPAATKTEDKFLQRLNETTGAVATDAGIDLVNQSGRVLLNLEKVD